MAVIDTLRPISTRKMGGGTAVPSGTLDEVTADDDDTTYIELSEVDAGDNWNLRVAPHTPPANHQRHRIRGRIRIRTDAGSALEDIDVGRGEFDWINSYTAWVDATFSEHTSDWFQDSGYGLATADALTDLNIGGGWLFYSEGATELRTSECYIDIDCRSRPEYSPEVRDGSGANQSGGTVADTNQPTLHFGSPNYDGLPARDWSVSVSGSSGEVFSASGSGTPPESVQVDTGLDDGSYTATFTVRSTIRGSDPFEHTQVIPFDVAVTIPPPSPPVLMVEEMFGGYRISWSNPGGQTWDNNYVVAEVWRDDCEGSHRIAVVPDGLNGSYFDLAIPQLDPRYSRVNSQCEVHAEECNITYRVRYHGYVSTFVELPDTIPQDLILAWPGSTASIPSGWSRVTALDGVFPRGETGTGTPTGTGGSASHSHTTPGHTHSIGSHSHSVGGNTGTSNASTTSARFTGASQPQADQPHNHSRPSSTGSRSSQNSGSSSPGTSSSSNLPPYRNVIWIQSDGAQTAYPIGVLAWSTESVSGWTDDAASAGRFLRGAPAGQNGGGTGGSSTHTHTVNSHSHSGFSHTHSIGATGQSKPRGVNAGFGSSTPRWLPRHTHPMSVGSSSTGSTHSASGGTTGSANHEPPNRRLRVLRNTGGGAQTRIIGLYLGNIASLDPLLSRCDGTNGTPDLRGWFVRDRGTASVGSTGGSETHSHSTPSHTHGMPSHSHSTSVSTSNTSSFLAPSFGDLGPSPTTGHTHSSGSTGSATPSVSSRSSGTTNTVNHLPPYRRVHFVRLDGTIGGGPLPVPELRVTDYASMTVPAFTYGDNLDRLSSTAQKIAFASERVYQLPRTVIDSIPLEGGLHTVATATPGQDLTLVIALKGRDAINQLEEILSEDLVYYSPVGGRSGWYAPAGWTVTSPFPDIKTLSVQLVRQDWPKTPDPTEFL